MKRDSATDQMKAIAEAVSRAGSQSALARKIGTTQATVWKWLNKGLPIKPELVLATEAATGVSRHRLRPDLYPLGSETAGRALPLGSIEAAR